MQKESYFMANRTEEEKRIILDTVEIVPRCDKNAWRKDH